MQIDNDQSKMISQLLFGELAKVIEKRGNWFYIRNYSDNIKGWIDGKSIKILNEEEFELVSQSLVVRVFDSYQRQLPAIWLSSKMKAVRLPKLVL